LGSLFAAINCCQVPQRVISFFGRSCLSLECLNH
jgi:hypothetical protein